MKFRNKLLILKQKLILVSVGFTMYHKELKDLGAKLYSIFI